MVPIEPYQSAVLGPLEILGIEKFGESQLVIRMMIKTAPLRQWEIGRELRKRIKHRFDEKGIEIPFPHRVVLWRDKDKSENSECQNPCLSDRQANVK
jgi:small-conductance mechanosensitive channel